MADYPFTTLYPNLGVVRVDEERSFVIADIPGVIAGAAEGAGLGLQFLRHLSRTRLLLHLVDIAPLDERPLLESVRSIEAEVAQFGSELADRERWLVLTKTDLLDETEAQQRCDALTGALNWQGPVFLVSSLAHRGTRELLFALADRLDAVRVSDKPAGDEAAAPYDPLS